MGIIKDGHIMVNMDILEVLFLEDITECGMIRNKISFLLILFLLCHCKKVDMFTYKIIETEKYKVHFNAYGNGTNASFRDSIFVFDKKTKVTIYKDGNYGLRDIGLRGNDTLDVYVHYYVDSADASRKINNELIILYHKNDKRKKIDTW